MARLPTGQEPEPLNQRMKRYHDELQKRGGYRLVADLDKEGKEALNLIRERDGVTIRIAVTQALLHYAKHKAKKSPAS